MPVKRKRDILNFDPNKSDSEDENFEPGEDRPRPRSKRSRPSKGGKPSRSRKSKYAGSDIDDDDGLDSEQEDSFGEDGFDDDGEEDEEAPVNAAGRRARKAAVKHQSYKESSEDEDVIQDSDAEKSDEAPRARQGRKIIKLKVPARAASGADPPTRRMTRAHTEEFEEELVELSNSGRHAQPARSSRSMSPEAAARNTRSSRAMKGLKKAPEPIEEATQESSVREPIDLADVDELAGDSEQVDKDVSEIKDTEMEDVVKESSAEDQPLEEKPAETVEAVEAVEPVQPVAAGEEEDEDDAPITRRTRAARASSGVAAVEESEADAEVQPRKGRLLRKSRLRKPIQEPSSDFEPVDESGGGENSESDRPEKNEEKEEDGDYDSPISRGRRSKRKGRSSKTSRRGEDSGEEVEIDPDELVEELHELRQDSRSRRRRPSPAILYQDSTPKRRRATAKPINYVLQPLTAANLEEDEQEDPAPTPARRRGRAGATQGWDRVLNTTYGPFGGAVTGGALLGGPWGTGAAGGVDSDSSDDEMVHRSSLAAGNVGMTPTSAVPPGLLGGLGQGLGAEGLAGVGATPNVGKIKSHKALADADPLGVDLSVDFSKVGGLQGHIDQLKEMVQLPLLYPELFLKFHVTPPRGVLFHGPPGTGKTLLARALANSVGTGGRKITFYMRKGADALSKWVGEAEKQLRLLFEEARRTQPSIIFFDEIDGLAPVRSSKQEQIHASIVSTLLALMDGMDGRGQVIVIGATNRPDNIDPALRRPGRFDREFYFPLPDIDGRRSIINIHTKDWGLSDDFKHHLAERTKGYGGADLRALATEAALNAIQRTYPQIYSAKEKLIVDPDKISVHATDFMLSIKKMIPSSERSASSGASPLPSSVEPLLRDQFNVIKRALDDLLPRKKKQTALEEAMYEQFDDADHGFGREALHQEFERSRIFRPRFLIHGLSGMGQTYLSSAILHYFEGVHVQHFDLASLLADGRVSIRST
jgi:ATPase family AAA domain-containing protein 2